MIRKKPLDTQLIALYEIKRQTFLIGYIQNPKHFSDALAYAYYNRIAPLFHESIDLEIYRADPFDGIYAVKRDFVDKVTKYVDQRVHDGDYDAIAFYALEEKFGGYKTNRMELIHTLEYTRIAGRFDQKVWAAIEKDAPVEATSLAASFSPNDVEFS
jgi:hypothetical protein